MKTKLDCAEEEDSVHIFRGVPLQSVLPNRYPFDEAISFSFCHVTLICCNF